MMRRRTRKNTLTATAVAVYLSLNVEIVDDRSGASVIAVPLWSLAWLLAAIWTAGEQVVRFRRRLSNRLNRLQTAWTLVGIGWRSVAWGVGI